MRKLVISFITMGTMSFGFAQNSNPKFQLSKFRNLDGFETNYEYLNDVQQGLTPRQVKYLENLVSYWDISKSKKFDGRKGQTFGVTFKSEKGYITADFDRNGKIVSAVERFSDFALPKEFGRVILEQYPKWQIARNRYSVWYERGEAIKKSFKVQIQNGDRKKWVKIDPFGDI